MTRALGVMGLPVPVAADDLRAYQTGALRDGGLWEALRRVGDHDHSGGEMGAPVAGAGGGTAEVTITGTEGVTVVESPANTFALGLTASAAANNTIVINPDGIYAAAGAIPPEYLTEAEADARYVNVTGDTVGGPLVVNANLVAGSGAVTASALLGAGVTLQAPAGNHRYVSFNSGTPGAGGSQRWLLEATTAPESGANAGSDLQLLRVADNESVLGAVFTIPRATGVVDFTSAPTVGGAALLTQTTADALFLTPAEGNAAYATPASVSSAISTHEGATNPHPTYLTQAEGDALYRPIGYVTDVTVTGTEGVTVVESPANTFALGLTASPDVNNTVEIRANGIYAAAGAIPPEYVTDAELTAALGPYATDAEVAALTTRVATLEAQVATLQAQMTGHTHTSGTIDAMGGTAVMP